MLLKCLLLFLHGFGIPSLAQGIPKLNAVSVRYYNPQWNLSLLEIRSSFDKNICPLCLSLGVAKGLFVYHFYKSRFFLRLVYKKTWTTWTTLFIIVHVNPLFIVIFCSKERITGIMLNKGWTERRTIIQYKISIKTRYQKGT